MMGRNLKVQRDDANNLIIIGVIVALIAMTVLFVFVSRMLPLIYLAAAILCFEIVCVMPGLMKRYMELYNVRAGALRFVPVWNMLSIFSPVRAKLLAVVSAAVFITGMIAFMPPLWAGGTDVLFFANLSYAAIGWFFVALIVLNFVIGAGYAGVYHDIMNIKMEFSRGRASKIEVVYYFMLFFPLMRCFALYNSCIVAKTMLDCGYTVSGRQIDEDFVEEGYLDE